MQEICKSGSMRGVVTALAAPLLLSECWNGEVRTIQHVAFRLMLSSAAL